MPELPEVETTRRGISPHIIGQEIKNVIVRQRQLRWPIPGDLSEHLIGQAIHSVERRAKYLLLDTGNGTLVIHLGMSGSLRILPADVAPEKHDHFDIVFANETLLRLRDPRRFGAVLWCHYPAVQHKLLTDLGVEPLSKDFTGDYLYRRARKRKLAIKQLIMDSHIVVGIGNIYANEALFLAGIRPSTQAHRISRVRMDNLVTACKKVLTRAIKSGGTSFRDFTRSDGRPGYFKQKLHVYGRGQQPCTICGTAIKLIRQQQRATYYCPTCQQR
ncbi:MAG: bifunctional DNA-formamidopyrimidine glycosylase/DNA-(apurinic or apyrimidinic site) lyase [Gammaproteobacteria bacterium]|jgi:formamidopyrimidine-DNA glycosylase